MKIKQSILYLLILSIFSCNNDDYSLQEISNLQTSHEVYRLEELNDTSKFAAPISSMEENRIFELETKLLGVLKFNFKVKKNVLIQGKNKILMGYVNQNIENAATLIVADNGYIINFLVNGEMHTIGKNENIDIGLSTYKQQLEKARFVIKNSELNISNLNLKTDFSKEDILSQIEKVINSPRSRNNTLYNEDEIFERGHDYNLVKLQVKGKKKLKHLKCPVKNILDVNSKQNGCCHPLTIEYFYNDFDPFEGSVAFTVLLNSLFQIIYFPAGYDINLTTYEPDYSVMSESEAITHAALYVESTIKVNKAARQLQKMISFYQNEVIPLNRPNEEYIVKTYASNSFWMDYIGLAYIGGYGTTGPLHTGGYMVASATVQNFGTLAHETGHVLGATHVPDEQDLMHRSVNLFAPAYYHKNLSNIATIENALEIN